MLNPVLIKDFLIYSRNRINLNVIMLYVFILCVIVFSMLWFVDTGKNLSTPEYRSSISFILFIYISLAIYSICPAFAINVMSSEKNEICLIKPTLLKNYQIISGKVAFISVLTFFLILLSFPIIVLVTPFIGFSLKSLSDCYLVVFISALAFSIIGILLSSILSKITALSLTYVIVGLLSVGTISIPLIMSKIMSIKLSSTIINALYGLSPFWVLSKKISELNLSDKIFTIPLWFYPILVYFLISTIAISLTFVFIRRW